MAREIAPRLALQDVRLRGDEFPRGRFAPVQDVVDDDRCQDGNRGGGGHGRILERLGTPANRSRRQELEIGVAVEPVAVRVDVDEARVELRRHGVPVAAGKREVFVAYGEKGIGRSRLRIPAAEAGTARNMNTVAKLAELARELE